MQGESSKNETVLFGHSFKKVHMGLDESEVSAYIKEILSHSDESARHEQSATLTRLIDKVAHEADAWAEQTRNEAREKAKSEADAIIASAESQAKKYAEEKRAEALEAAQKDAEILKIQANIQIEAWLKETKETVAAQIQGIGAILCSEMRSQADVLKKRAASFEEELEDRITELLNRDLAIEQCPAVSKSESAPAAQEHSEFTPNPAKAEAPVASSQPITAEIEASNRESWYELEIISPNDAAAEAFRTRLNQISGIAAVRMEESSDKTILSAYFKKPLDVVKTLMQLPQVTRVERVSEDEKERIRVTIGGKAKIQHVTPLEIPLTWQEH
jgi:hypothetical protein